MRATLLFLLLCLAAALAAPAAPAQAPADSVRVARAARLAGALRLDGRLDEAAWSAAAPAAGFTESWPSPRAPARDATEARVLYDDAALYVGVRMHDARPDSIAAQLARRDASGIYSDWVHVMVDSYHDRRTAFRFSANPRGVQKDVFHSDDGNEDASWDAVWTVATRVDSAGWTAEFRIPFSQLRFGPQPAGSERVWGLGIQRDVARREERTSWSPWTRDDGGFVSRFGELRGLVGVPTPTRLELQPYTSARVTRAPGDRGDPFHASTDAAASVGADVRYGLPSGLTLTATVNPDFGQVEVDPAVVNLSAFESFFDERRPFFVEGSDIFQFGHPTASFNDYGYTPVFYSRRVGRQPQRGLGALSPVYADVPEQTTIAAAVEPLTNYFAGRVRRDLRGGRTVVGGMATAVNRQLEDPALAGLLRSSAYLAGVDWDHAWADRSWNLNGFLAGSRIGGERGVLAAAQNSSARYFGRPDADHLSVDSTRTSLEGYAGALSLAKTGGRHWLGSLTFQTTSPGFEVNDVGFQSRADVRALSTFLQYRENRAGRRFRSYTVYGFTNHARNFGGDRVFDAYALAGNVQLAGFWTVGSRAGYSPEYANDRLTRGGPLAAVPAQWNVSLDVRSDSRRRYVAGTSLYYREDASGEYDRVVGGSLEMRPSSTVLLRLEPSVAWERDTDQFVRSAADPRAEATFGRRFVFADVEQTTVSMGTRLDWTFTPHLSLQLYAEPFVAAADFSGYKEFLRPGGYDFGVYGRGHGTLREEGGRFVADPDGAGPAPSFAFGEAFGQRDFTLRSLRGNAVLRWEYRPGSALFLVWQQDRGGVGEGGAFDLGRDADALFGAPASNVFLLKATYRIGR